jgi:hypothetical protein
MPGGHLVSPRLHFTNVVQAGYNQLEPRSGGVHKLPGGQVPVQVWADSLQGLHPWLLLRGGRQLARAMPCGELLQCDWRHLVRNVRSGSAGLLGTDGQRAA